MAEIVSPAPIRIPVVDERGLMTQPWILWTRAIFARIGGSVSESIPEMAESLAINAGAEESKAESFASFDALEQSPANQQLLAIEYLETQIRALAEEAAAIKAMMVDQAPAAFAPSPGLIDAAHVKITGGTIDGTSIGATSPLDGKFTTLESTAGLTKLGSAGGAGDRTLVSAPTDDGVSEFQVGGVARVEGGAALNATSGRTLVGAIADDGATQLQISGGIRALGSVKHGDGGAIVICTSAFGNGAGAALGTLANAPAAGNPTKWLPINDNGTTRYIPSW